MSFPFYVDDIVVLGDELMKPFLFWLVTSVQIDFQTFIKRFVWTAIDTRKSFSNKQIFKFFFSNW